MKHMIFLFIVWLPPYSHVGRTFSISVHLLNLRDKMSCVFLVCIIDFNNRTSTDFEVKLSVLRRTLPHASSFLVGEWITSVHFYASIFIQLPGKKKKNLIFVYPNAKPKMYRWLLCCVTFLCTSMFRGGTLSFSPESTHLAPARLTCFVVWWEIF